MFCLRGGAIYEGSAYCVVNEGGGHRMGICPPSTLLYTYLLMVLLKLHCQGFICEGGGGGAGEAPNGSTYPLTAPHYRYMY